MFKIGNLKQLTNIKTEIDILDCSVKDYSKSIQYSYKYLDFNVYGENNGNEYSLSFRLNKPISSLLDIELNTCIPIQEYIDIDDIQFEVNGILDFDSLIKGEIYRIINKNIIIKLVFVSSADDYVGTAEIEFNLDDYLNNDEESDI